ncbi:beta-ketoacyl-[acyl-carrier-protein] synthase family protein [Paludisphaera mucosa]|uniref:Beta-ketoacyl-[acyl-carrier-protein] synthase family protein n=1 Tax=Paludisphaera mucosa TaxID=3030827 RepID=A0ABT6F5E7_9BACT|nr:beta-ketoacyl-[acyl-carrier-protein] synthase family protein [Paludisphaera mucosa]MDG3002784.1 beta-ketoacyl-[acyl-carrier-protein] synthase family protein [Paludisphaera mucosa]
MAEPVFVVGHGAITCLGIDMDATWRGLIAGESGIRRHASLDREQYLQDVAGLVEGLEAASRNEDREFARLSARFLSLAMVAARAAWADAGLGGVEDRIDRDRVAVAVGSAFGGMDFLEAQQARMRKRKDLSTSPFLVPGLLVNQAGGQISQQLRLYGPGVAPANACASGGHAIIMGAMMLRAGDADLALCGAGESAFTPAIVNGFSTMKALFNARPGDRSEADASQASRPFSRDRSGFVMSEGAGMVVLATGKAVERLGLTPQAELAGYAMNSDGYHMATPSPERIRRCVELALEKAGMGPEEIDYYNAHGTSTTINDQVETGVVKQVFGDRAKAPPVSSIKGAIGHTLGAASAVEAAACLRALRDQVVPPTVNHVPDPELDLDYVPDEARAARLDAVMSASFGFGGTNNVLIFRKPRG